MRALVVFAMLLLFIPAVLAQVSYQTLPTSGRASSSAWSSSWWDGTQVASSGTTRPSPVSIGTVDTAACTREGQIPVLAACCKGFMVVNGKCKKVSLQPVVPVQLPCAPQDTVPARGQPCCAELELHEGVCRRFAGECARLWQHPEDYRNGCCRGFVEARSWCLRQGCSRDELHSSAEFAEGCCEGLRNDIDGRCRRPCARENQRADAHEGRCCRGYVLGTDGKCRRSLGDCAVLNQNPNQYTNGCCNGFVPVGTVCKRRGCASRMSRMADYAEGCCEGLTQDIDNTCRPPCARQGQRADEHGGSCCRNHVLGSDGVCRSARGECARPGQDPDYYLEGCCRGYTNVNGHCKRNGCAPPGYYPHDYAEGCCRGLILTMGRCSRPE